MYMCIMCMYTYIYICIQINMATRTAISFLNCCKSRIVNPTRSIYAVNLVGFKHNIVNKLNYIKSCELTDSSNLRIISNNFTYLMCKRFKSKTKSGKKAADIDSDDEEEMNDELDPHIQTMLASSKHSKLVIVNSSSMRIDAIVKAGSGLSRNKVELALYENKIRINGQKILKKGKQVGINDEVDYIQGPSPNNPKFLVVMRFTVLDANSTEDGYRVKILRDKSLTIENYDETPRGASSESDKTNETW